jgi:hypothetical protein
VFPSSPCSFWPVAAARGGFALICVTLIFHLLPEVPRSRP